MHTGEKTGEKSRGSGTAYARRGGNVRPKEKTACSALSAKRFYCCRCGRKPSSVVGRSSIYAARCRTAQAFSLRARRAAVLPLIGTCIGWGLQRVSVTGTRVSSYLAFPSLPGKNPGGLFLLHFPWSCLHRPLTGTLPCDARTFLMTCATRSPGRPAAAKRIARWGRIVKKDGA